MFSHTVKGQLYNMELLSKFLASENPGAPQDGSLLPRLIDYELLTGPDGKRTVGFGWFAGGEWMYGFRASFVSPKPSFTCWLTCAPSFAVAGALEALCAMAHAHLELGVASPFLVSAIYVRCFCESDHGLSGPLDHIRTPR